MKYLKYLLFFVPVSFIFQALKMNEGWVFVTICLSIIPLAAVMGNATEQIAIYTGPKAGGLLNATMGNVPELLIGLFAAKAGLFSLVLAGMAGSIIGNILLVLGFSIMLGGFKHKYQYFSKSIARSNFILLFFTATSIIIPFSLKYAIQGHNSMNVKAGMTAISLSIALILIIIYISGLIFSLVTHRNVFIKQEKHEEAPEKAKWSLSLSIVILVAAAVFTAAESEMLVGTVENIINYYNFSEVFMGIIIIPILGNVAEHVSAIIMAVKNKVDISIEIAIGSSIQIALFVAPLLIIFSFIIGNPIIYLFDAFELVAVLISIGLSLYVFQDGKTYWLEGLILVSCYIILGIAFYFI